MSVGFGLFHYSTEAKNVSSRFTLAANRSEGSKSKSGFLVAQPVALTLCQAAKPIIFDHMCRGSVSFLEILPLFTAALNSALYGLIFGFSFCSDFVEGLSLACSELEYNQ